MFRTLAVSLSLLLLGLSAGAAEDVLLVDKTLEDPLAFATLFEDYDELGLDFRYRRWYPYLVERDARDFDIIIVAGGGYPGPSTARFSLEEAALLTEFVTDGGTLLILGYGGSNDKYVLNKVLDDLGLALRLEGDSIGDQMGYLSTLVPSSYFLSLPMLEVQDETPLAAGLDGPIFGGGAGSLMVGKPEGFEISVTSMDTAMRRVGMKSSPERNLEASYAAEPRAYPVVVAAKAGEGHVVVMPKRLLNKNGYVGSWSDKPILPPYELSNNRRFEKNLAKYLVDLTTGAYELTSHVPIRRVLPLQELEAPKKEVLAHTLRATAPPGSYEDLIDFDPVTPDVPPFMNGEKVKSAYLQWPPHNAQASELNARVAAETGMNLLYVMVADQMWKQRNNPEEMAKYDTRVRDFLDACQKYDIKVMLGGFLPLREAWKEKDYASALFDGNGTKYEIPSPFDPEMLEDGFVTPARAIAAYARDYPDTMVGYLWDFELYGHRELIVSENYSFDDLSYSKFLERKGRKLQQRGLYEEAPRVKPGDRFLWLAERGLLDDYYDALEDAVYDMMREARRRIDEVHDGLFWGFYVAGIPQSWYYRGAFRALGDREGRVLAVTYEARGLQQMSYWRALGVNLCHMPGSLYNCPGEEEWVPFLRMCLENESGYWLFPGLPFTQTGDGWKYGRHDWNIRVRPERLKELVTEANK